MDVRSGTLSLLFDSVHNGLSTSVGGGGDDHDCDYSVETLGSRRRVEETDELG